MKTFKKKKKVALPVPLKKIHLSITIEIILLKPVFLFLLFEFLFP